MFSVGTCFPSRHASHRDMLPIATGPTASRPILGGQTCPTRRIKMRGLAQQKAVRNAAWRLARPRSQQIIPSSTHGSIAQRVKMGNRGNV